MELRNELLPRYGIEIKVDSKHGIRRKSVTRHVECMNLSKVLHFIDTPDGDIRIFDRHHRTLVLHGHSIELRQFLWSCTMSQEHDIREPMACHPLVAF